MPLAHTDHLTLPEYVSYLERYAEHFRLRERATVRMSTRVEHVERGSGAGASDPVDGKGGHWVTYRGKDGEQHREHFNHLCLCTGLHVVPAVPEIPGMPPVQQEVQEIPSSTVSDKPDELPSSNGEIPASSDGKPTSNSDGDAVMAKEDKNNKLASSSHLSPAQSRIRALHSSNYRHPSLFTNKRVLILGTGETGMDMAYEAVKAGASEIVLCTRAGFLMFPAVLADFVVFGVKFDGSLPIDGLITNLFETHGVHPWVAARHLRWHVCEFCLSAPFASFLGLDPHIAVAWQLLLFFSTADFVIKRVLWVLTGTEAGCNQWVGELEPARLGRAYVFLNKSSKAMPVRPFLCLFSIIMHLLTSSSYRALNPTVRRSRYSTSTAVGRTDLGCLSVSHPTSTHPPFYHTNPQSTLRPSHPISPPMDASFSNAMKEKKI